MTFENKYNNIKNLTRKEINFIEDYMVQNIEIREPLKSHIINFLTAPSKRVRPVLSVLFFKSCYGKISDEQLKALSAVELIHNASLIHDDIIDQSELRRGLKTTSKEFGNKLGVISGDYLLSVAMKIATELGSIELLKNFSNTLNKMCIGEINQNFDRYKIGTIGDYIEKSKNKTAYLFETALLTPFFFTSEENNKYSVRQLASDFGLNAGLAFQIRDDLSNLIKKDKSKPVQNDITEGIYNAPIIYAQSVENYIDGIVKTKDLLDNYINQAYSAIKYLPVNKYKEGLDNFLELLNND